MTEPCRRLSSASRREHVTAGGRARREGDGRPAPNTPSGVCFRPLARGDDALRAQTVQRRAAEGGATDAMKLANSSPTTMRDSETDLRAQAVAQLARRAFARRVLIVDDDDHVRECIAECLRLEGFLVATSRDADEALGRLATGSLPHVILIEHAMHELRDRLRADATWRRLPVIVMCPEAAVAFDELASSRVIRKPVEVDALVDDLRSLEVESIRPPPTLS